MSPDPDFYAELGRWLSRDPLLESDGMNLYAYILNNPICNIDPLGLFHVSKCEILILFGHGDFKKPWKFDFETPDCSAAWFSGCSSNATNSAIPPSNALGGDPTDPRMKMDNGCINDEQQYWQIVHLVEAAIIKAKKMKCCKTVKLTYTYLKSDDWWTNTKDIGKGDNGATIKSHPETFPTEVPGGAP